MSYPVGLPLIIVLAAGCTSSAHRRGDDALGQGRYREAIEAYDEARPEVGGPAVDGSLASAHRALAMSLVESRACDDAARHFAHAEALTHVVRADRESVAACYDAAGAGAETRLAAWSALVEWGDTRATTLQRVLQLAFEAGDDEQAVRQLAALEERHAVTDEDRKRLAGALIRLGREEEALPIMARVADLFRRDPLTRLKYAELLEQTGDVVAARVEYDALGRDFDDHVLIHGRRAAFYRRVGDDQAALEAQDRAETLRATSTPERNLRRLRRSRR